MMEHELNYLGEKFNLLMSVDEEDKKRFKKIITWASQSMDLSVKEKLVKGIVPKRGEVWTCNFGENVGSEICGVRPALILQHNEANERSTTTVVAPITSREVRYQSHVAVEESDIVFVEHELSGTVVTEQTRMVSKARLGRKIAELSDFMLRKVEKSIMHSMGFPEDAFIVYDLIAEEISLVDYEVPQTA